MVTVIVVAATIITTTTAAIIIIPIAIILAQNRHLLIPLRIILMLDLRQYIRIILINYPIMAIKALHRTAAIATV